MDEASIERLEEAFALARDAYLETMADRYLGSADAAAGRERRCEFLDRHRAAMTWRHVVDQAIHGGVLRSGRAMVLAAIACKVATDHGIRAATVYQLSGGALDPSGLTGQLALSD